MLRILQSINTQPFSFIVDPNGEFQPGQIAQLNVFGNQIVCGVSDGTCPLGIIDDMKTHAFTTTVIDEAVIASVPDPILNSSNQLVTPVDIKVELANPHIMPDSFVSDPVNVHLNFKNGVITFIAGTPLNFDLTGSGTPNAIRTVVSYSYRIANVQGEDSTQGSQRITVWSGRMIAATDQFETNRHYPLNANLFVSQKGMLTTQRITEYHPPVAFVTGPPTAFDSYLEFMWL